MSLVSPGRGGVRDFSGHNLPPIVLDPQRTEPDVAPTGLLNSTGRVLPHGWLAVG